MPPTVTFEQQVIAILKDIQQTMKELAQKLEQIESNQLSKG